MFIGERAPLDYGYLNWLYRIIHAEPGNDFQDWQMLLYRLHQTPYRPENPFDSNRAEDGKELRRYYEQYGDEWFTIPSPAYRKNTTAFYDANIEAECSMLEFMIALSKRIDETQLPKWHVDRTFVWFWMMVEALGIADYDDYHFDPHDTDCEVDRILAWFNLGCFSGTVPTARIFDIHDPTYNWYGVQQWDLMNKWVFDYYEYLVNIDEKAFPIDFKYRRS